MCIFYCSPIGSKIPYDHLLEGQKSNPHGIGFSYTNEQNELVLKKGFKSFKEFWTDFKDINGIRPSIVHFRWVSVGPRNEDNCHPFKITEDWNGQHNGTLSGYTKFKNSLNDTQNFFRLIVKPLVEDDPKALEKPHIHALLSQGIGENNKLAFINRNGKIIIINDHLGNWGSNGVFYSNFDFVRKKKRNKNKNKDLVVI